MSWTKQKQVRKGKKDVIRERKIDHSIERAKERYGLCLEERDIAKIARKIRQNDSICLEQKSRTRSLHLVEYQGENMVVVYDKRRKTIATILGRNSREYRKYIKDRYVQNVSGQYAAGGSN